MGDAKRNRTAQLRRQQTDETIATYAKEQIEAYNFVSLILTGIIRMEPEPEIPFVKIKK